MYKPNAILLILLLILALLLLSVLLPLPRPILLPIPVPIPSSHALIGWNKKNFLDENISFGISSNSTNANLGALVNSGALSHVDYTRISPKIMYNNKTQKVFETQISGGANNRKAKLSERRLCCVN